SSYWWEGYFFYMILVLAGAVVGLVGACTDADLPALLAVLDPDVVLRGDGGGKVRALRHTVRGAGTAGPVLLSYLRRPPEAMRLVDVNGAPGLLLRDGTGVLTVIAFTVVGGRVAAIDVVRNPDKLGTVRADLLDADPA
ncbi:hypothetical protein QVL82_19955, partial [Cellulosimicrobium funkei]